MVTRILPGSRAAEIVARHAAPVAIKLCPSPRQGQGLTPILLAPARRPVLKRQRVA